MPVWGKRDRDIEVEIDRQTDIYTEGGRETQKSIDTKNFKRYIN